jgi:hypothetical protein
MAPPPDQQQQLENLESNLTSAAARVSNIIKDAFRNASDAVQKDIIKAAGASLLSTYSKLISSSAEFSKNASNINKGLLDSKGLSEQLLNLEQQKQEFLLKAATAESRGIPIEQERINRALRYVDAQKSILESQKAIVDSTAKQVGLIGKVAGGLAKIPGLGTVINAKGVVDALREASIGLDKNGNLVKKNTNGFGMMAIAAKTVGKQFTTAMLDPAAIVGKIVEQFFAINKASVELRRLTGDTAVSFNIFANGAASSVQILETAAELTKQIGFNAQSAFSQEVIANAADLKVEMGLAAAEAGGIAMMAQTSGKSVDSITDSVVDTTSAFNRANRSAVSQGVVLRDVAKTSDSIKLSLGNNDVAIAKAASQARRLGMDLNQVDKIAQSLLNFESSIESELEAQLLTGNQINLSKAREMALTGDISGLQDEIFKNTVDIEKFGKMGRLGQEAQAKALGMTRDELARVAYLRAIDNNMTDEAAAKAANVNAEDMKRITIQENFTAALNKVMGALAPILEYVGQIFSIPFLGPTIAAVVVAIPLLSTLAGGMTALKSAQALATIATASQTTATLLQAGANTTLAGTQTIVATTGAATSGVFASMGIALGAFGTAATPAIGVLLSIGVVAAGIGLAFMGLAQSLKTIPEILKEITLEKAAAVFVLATSFASLAAGLAAVALAGPMALPVLLATGALAAGIGMIATAGGASPGGAAIAGAQKPVESPQAPAASLSLDPLVTEIKLMREEMTSLMKQVMGREIKVYLDGYLVGQGTQQAQTSSG